MAARDLGAVATLGLDETLFASARPGARAAWCAGLCDLDRSWMIDLTRERSQQAAKCWLEGRDPKWRAGVGVMALYPHAGYAAAVRQTMGPRPAVMLRGPRTGHRPTTAASLQSLRRRRRRP